MTSVLQIKMKSQENLCFSFQETEWAEMGNRNFLWVLGCHQESWWSKTWKTSFFQARISQLANPVEFLWHHKSITKFKMRLYFNRVFKDSEIKDRWKDIKIRGRRITHIMQNVWDKIDWGQPDFGGHWMLELGVYTWFSIEGSWIYRWYWSNALGRFLRYGGQIAEALNQAEDDS